MKFTELAVNESANTIHPGIPGKRPFWNTYSKRFIYAQAFEFDKIKGASVYRFRVVSEVDSQEYQFTADVPWHSLSPVWKELPNHNFILKVEALNDNQEVTGIAGERKFMKSPSFQGVKTQPAYDYKESGFCGLKDLLHQDKIQYWLKTGKPDPKYPLWVHPTKIIGAVAAGMIHYAHLFPNEPDAQEAEKMAGMTADFLLSMIEPEGRPLQFWPPTYWDGVPRELHPVYHNEIMTNYPAEGAMMFLDMYDFTHDQKYFDAAVRIADTYVMSQDDDGTWPQLLNTDTGEAVKTNRLIPTGVIKLFDRLLKQYNLNNFQESRKNAFNFCIENPVKTFHWQAQFEDTRPQSLYKNLSRKEATDLAILLFDAQPGNKEYSDLAPDLLRFAEDQFVVWEKDDPAASYPWFKKDSQWNGTTLDSGCDWFFPCVLEQYKFYTPISLSNQSMIVAFLKAFEVTGEPIYHAKALALANALTQAQKFQGGGEIPTHLRKTLPELNWINCGVYPAIGLIDYADVLNIKIEY